MDEDKILKCETCDKEFYESQIVDKDNWYDDAFGTVHYTTHECPFCGSQHFNEIKEEE